MQGETNVPDIILEAEVEVEIEAEVEVEIEAKVEVVLAVERIVVITIIILEEEIGHNLFVDKNVSVVIVFSIA